MIIKSSYDRESANFTGTLPVNAHNSDANDENKNNHPATTLVPNTYDQSKSDQHSIARSFSQYVITPYFKVSALPSKFTDNLERPSFISDPPVKNILDPEFIKVFSDSLTITPYFNIFNNDQSESNHVDIALWPSTDDRKKDDHPPIKQKIISFRLTKNQLLSGSKTVTRRIWTERTVRSWQKAYDEGRYCHKAYDGLPRNKGKQIGLIHLIQRPYLEKLSDMPKFDTAAEGFPGLTRQEFIDRFFDGDGDCLVAVIRFIFAPIPELKEDAI